MAGALGEALEVLLGGGVVGDDLEYVADLDGVDALARLEQRLRTVQPDAVERESRCRFVCHAVSLRVSGGASCLPPAQSIPDRPGWYSRRRPRPSCRAGRAGATPASGTAGSPARTKPSARVTRDGRHGDGGDGAGRGGPAAVRRGRRGRSWPDESTPRSSCIRRRASPPTSLASGRRSCRGTPSAACSSRARRAPTSGSSSRSARPGLGLRSTPAASSGRRCAPGSRRRSSSSTASPRAGRRSRRR